MVAETRQLTVQELSQRMEEMASRTDKLSRGFSRMEEMMAQLLAREPPSTPIRSPEVGDPSRSGGSTPIPMPDPPDLSRAGQMSTVRPQFGLAQAPGNPIFPGGLATRLAKVEFPRFDGTLTREWISRCEQFFLLDNTLPEMKVRLASLHLEGKALQWHHNYIKSRALYSNNISGSIPPELGNLTSLVSLELYQNKLTGPIPDELGKLSKLRFLRLNNNNLSGTIPWSLTTIFMLQVLDLSFNNLSGSPPVNGSFSLFTPVSFVGNPNRFYRVYHGPPISSSSQSTTLMTQARVDVRNIVVVVAATALFAACTAAFVWRRRGKDQDHFFDVSAEDDPEFNSGALYWFSPRALYNFTLGELQVATDNFDPKNMVGKGGFGEVYKGCLADGSLVAVKRLKVVQNKVEELQFQTEVELISLVVHPNLLRLQGFCMTSTEKLLVYPFMANGSVASCLQAGQGSQPLLDWPRRKQIALGSARGLAYLHHQFEPQVIHRDVKAANVLLDDKFEAVVGDFGLVKLMGFKDTHITTTVCGTIGHIAPEYFTNGECSEKTDVFGYGVMLLELLSGQKATDLAKVAIGDGFMLHEWVKGLLKDKKLERLVDANLQGDYIEEEVEQIIQVALLCTHNSPMQRPAMREVVRMLQGHGLAKRRWEELLKQEVLYRESFHALHPNSAWIVDSTSKIRPDELSGPR